MDLVLLVWADSLVDTSTLYDDLLPVVHDLRGIAGELGFRRFTVQVVKETYGTGNVTMGKKPTVTALITITEGESDNPQNPKVRQLSTEDYYRGAHPDATLEVGPLSPSFIGDDGYVAGADWTFLEQADAEKGSQIYYIVTGAGFEGGVRFQKVQFSGQRALGYFIQLKRV